MIQKLRLCLFTLVFMPLFSQAQYVQLGDDIDGESFGDFSGWSCSLSEDGNRICVGEQYNNEGTATSGSGSNFGQIRCYEWNGANWIALGDETHGEVTADNFGSSISLNAAGNIYISGARNGTVGATRNGYARVHQLIAGSWQQIGSILEGQNEGDNFAKTVSINAAGTIIAIGAPNNDTAASNAGQTIIYQRVAGVWTILGAPINGIDTDDLSGTSVSLSDDGFTVAIGANDDDSSGAQVGAVRIYDFNGTTWSLKGNVIYSASDVNNFGHNVSLNSDGSVVAIGDPSSDEAGNNYGLVQVYEFNGTTWTQRGQDMVGSNTFDNFGNALSLDSDGNTLLIGAHQSTSDVGYAQFFEYNGISWVQVGATIDAENTGQTQSQYFAHSTSISGDGLTGAMGDYYNQNEGDTFPIPKGSTQVYRRDVPTGADPVASCQNITVSLDATGTVTILPQDVDDGSFDADGPITLSISQDTFTCANLGSNSITLTVTDNESNTAMCTAMVTVEDVTAPSITCPADENVDFDSSCQFTIPDYTGLATTSDACDTAPTVTQNPLPGTVISAATTITLTVADVSGNSDFCTFNVIPSDNTAPSLSCPSDQTEDLDTNCEFTLPNYTTLATVFDTCDPNPTVTQSPAPGTVITTATVVTIFAEDVDGNIDSCTFNVTPVDTTPPTITCPATQNESADASCMFTLPDYTTLAVVIDNCSMTSITQSPAPGTIIGSGTTIVTLEANDGTNVSSCTFNVFVADTTPPTAVCQDITAQLDATGMVVLTAAEIDNGSSDACSSVTLSVSPNTFNCSHVGNPQSVTLTVSDANGNMSSCNAVVTIEDTIAPVALCQDITLTLGSENSVTILPSQLDGGSSDNCSVGSISASQTTFTCDDIGTNSVVVTVTDVNGNSSSCTALVTIVENTPPIAVCQPFTAQLDVAGTITILATDVDGGSTDNCAIDTIVLSQDTFDCNDIGENTILVTVTDTSGNSASCTTIVTVMDTVAPEAICQDITVQLDGNATATIVPSDIDGGSTDACGIALLEIDVDTFTCNDIGSNIVTLTVTDTNGNVSSCTATVTVEEEQTPPVAVCQNITATLDSNGTVTIPASSVDAGSTGLSCTGGLSLDIDTFDCSDVGTPIQVTLTVTNGNGTIDSCTSFVNVVDPLDPIITCPENQEVTSSGPYILPDYVALGDVFVTDNCGSESTIEQDPAPGTLMEQGEYLINFRALDPSANEALCSFRLTVTDVLGISENNTINKVAIFPNPAQEYFIISNPLAIPLTHVKLYDMTGRLVFNQPLTNTTEKIVNISHLASASYIIILSSETQQRVTQFVKK
ncbi:HYR domain-containing protein [Rasiella rasia]|uniref:HYR domain-containing protein n=1 Tax=Rasiella rasia TaxID=2744027 RepID=A0A6G6GKB1_9FLAO|nr:HYR domain-containing protein [Rasiella rasia]QIE59015.1 HYR domain-containing protein [Rasiella rasia]